MKKSAQNTGVQIPDNIAQIALLVRKDWKNVYFGAVPYLDAMHSLSSVNESYYEDSASSIINYFLANATTWRGEVARAVKAKLKQLVASAN
ncbi:hypothetical protein H3Z85_00910 [Chryseobacterium indologenes]|uniref:Uncharacterized protein n=3 Tax=Chryseobacterium TaxID=59732 RepID=A0A3G6RJ32_CHRLC|nr:MULTISPECIES: hypothetical protein [Bacteroidota]AZA84593.1 hypothetical protein EG342_23045 [Chryseobacterium lactis]AZB04981.1 hypothetical protein EG341_13925 [Chryseobacterium lactis]KMQ64453.1 hypothetical protein ACM46_09265 [Chryseobacterium angstadtii]MBF6643600.1 hypothetical protein [Chryseobacterium indologenes]PNW14712.1 hypothetical protein C1637_07075 [Chryseobacterium lactis]